MHSRTSDTDYETLSTMKCQVDPVLCHVKVITVDAVRRYTWQKLKSLWGYDYVMSIDEDKGIVSGLWPGSNCDMNLQHSHLKAAYIF